MNHLYYGDNLDVLREHLKDETVDLVYLDPPFKSNQDYNVLFEEQDGTRSAAQIKAFEDTWRWDQAAAAAYETVVEAGGRVSQAMQAFRTFLGDTDMLAYLAMMAPRLVELQRVLKPTGSIYLHCDPTASHYLKMLMDAVFGPKNFRNEIIWRRTSAHSDSKQGAQHYGRVHDVLLFYSSSDVVTWNQQYIPHSEEYVRVHYPHTDPTGRRYGLWDITGPGGAAKGNPQYEIFGVTKYWRYSRVSMEQKIKEGKVFSLGPERFPARFATLTKRRASRSPLSGQTSPRSTLRRRSVSAIQRRNRKHCWKEYSAQAAMRAMLYSIHSAGVEQPSLWHNGLLESGSGSTSPISPSP